MAKDKSGKGDKASKGVGAKPGPENKGKLAGEAISASDKEAAPSASDAADNGGYLDILASMQLELIKLQRQWVETGAKTLLIFEGRDAAGKDGAIKALTEHMSVRQTRVVALPKPNEREKASWYFQRYIAHLPAAGETVIFNRSWYNRAGVEPVMGFCTPAEHKQFLDTVADFESVLVRSGIKLVKFYIDISKKEQAQRLKDRQEDPLDYWKLGPIDAFAQSKWDDYGARRNEMLLATHTDRAPWTIVRGDKKKRARLAVIASLLAADDYPKKNRELANLDPNVIFPFEPLAITDGRLFK